MDCRQHHISTGLVIRISRFDPLFDCREAGTLQIYNDDDDDDDDDDDGDNDDDDDDQDYNDDDYNLLFHNTFDYCKIKHDVEAFTQHILTDDAFIIYNHIYVCIFIYIPIS